MSIEKLKSQLYIKAISVNMYAKFLCLYEHITDHFVCFVSCVVCVDLSSALSLGNFLITL